MRRRLISSVVGLAFLMSVSTTAMALEIPQVKKEQVREKGIYINRITEDHKMIISGILTESELNEMMDKMNINKSEKEKLVVSYKENLKRNEEIDKILKTFNQNQEKMPKEDLVKKINNLGKENLEIFTLDMLNKAADLGFLEKLELDKNFSIRFSKDKELSIGEVKKDVVSGFEISNESIELLSTEMQLAFVESLKEILEKAKFTVSEKEAILKIQKNNELVFKKINELYANEDKLSREEIFKKVEKLEKEISPIFTQEQLKKIEELDLLKKGNLESSIEGVGKIIKDSDFEQSLGIIKVDAINGLRIE